MRVPVHYPLAAYGLAFNGAHAPHLGPNRTNTLPWNVQKIITLPSRPRKPEFLLLGASTGSACERRTPHALAGPIHTVWTLTNSRMPYSDNSRP
jgi:hypothetical protein